MIRIFLVLVGVIEVAALLNRGGGPLMAHLVLTGVVAIMTFVFVVAVWRKKIKVRWGLPVFFYALFLVFFLASFLASLTPQFGVNELLLFANTGLLLIIFSSMEANLADLRFFSRFLIALATVEVLFGIFIYTQTPFPRFTGSFLDLARPYTSFGNDFANWMLLVIPLAVAEFLRNHERVTTKILTGVALALILSGFLLSFSRAGWLSLIVAGLVAATWYGVHSLRAKKKLNASIVVRTVAVIALTILIVQGIQSTRAVRYPTTSFLDKIFMRADEGGASASERTAFWKGAAQIIKNRPLLGGGVQSFKYLFPRYQTSFGITWDHPHNIFLKIGVENGVIAMVFFAAFLLSSAGVFLPFLRSAPFHAALPLLIGALGALGHNLIDYNFIVSNFTLMMVFIALGLGVAMKQEKTSGYPRAIVASMLVATMLLSALGAHEAYFNFYFKRGREALAARRMQDAVMLLERARGMWFPRDHSTYLAPASTDRRDKEIALIQAETRHSIDATLFNRLGELYVEKKDYKNAEALFEKSLSLDPQNHLRYYYNFFAVRNAENIPVDPVRIAFTKKLLAEYLEVLAHNNHFTILTDNQKYASKLYELLGMRKEHEVFAALWFQELINFTIKYGKIDNPVL